MTAPADAPQQWPCGTDCAFAQPSPGTYGEWIWCTRPDAAERLRPAGEECAGFQSAESGAGTGRLSHRIAPPAGHNLPQGAR